MKTTTYRLSAATLVAALVSGCGGSGSGSFGSVGPKATAPSETVLSTSRCPQHFAASVPPAVTNVKLQSRTQKLCYEAFAVLHSGISRTPLYSAEYLTRERITAADALNRIDSFHAETALPAADRAELSDYARSGYDRGHMAPNADMPTRTAQAESFSLANMVPQVHANNAGIWAGMEQAMRRLATDQGQVYVVSGPAFLGSDIKQIGNVLVPTHLWKAVYSPSQQQAAAYVIKNDESKDYRVVSIAQLEQMVGINALPGLSQAVRNAAMTLPRPAGAGALVQQLD